MKEIRFSDKLCFAWFRTCVKFVVQISNDNTVIWRNLFYAVALVSSTNYFQKNNKPLLFVLIIHNRNGSMNSSDFIRIFVSRKYQIKSNSVETIFYQFELENRYSLCASIGTLSDLYSAATTVSGDTLKVIALVIYKLHFLVIFTGGCGLIPPLLNNCTLLFVPLKTGLH